jgi:sterol desaturase/sphingolipid hydroxylase (fatty acid hydroxylase superfamily)
MLTWITATAFVACNLLGLAWSVHLETPEQRARDPLARRLPRLAANLAGLVTGVVVGMPWLTDWFTPGLGSVGGAVGGFVILLVVDDVWFYALHRLMHEVPWLYRTVHGLHHTRREPLPSDYLYVHPVELSLGALGVAVGGVVAAGVFGTVSPVGFVGYAVWRNLRELSIHSGARSWIHRVLPFVAPNEHHALHHALHRVGNYASMLSVWDRLTGTVGVDTRRRVARPRAVPQRAA